MGSAAQARGALHCARRRRVCLLLNTGGGRPRIWAEIVNCVPQTQRSNTTTPLSCLQKSVDGQTVSERRLPGGMHESYMTDGARYIEPAPLVHTALGLACGSVPFAHARGATRIVSSMGVPLRGVAICARWLTERSQQQRSMSV